MASSVSLGAPTHSFDHNNNNVTVSVGSSSNDVREIIFELRSSGLATETFSAGVVTTTGSAFINSSFTFTNLEPGRQYTVQAVALSVPGSNQIGTSVNHSFTVPSNWNHWWGHGTSANWIQLEPVSMSRDSVSIRVHAWGWDGRWSNWNDHWNSWQGWDESSHGAIRNVGVLISRSGTPTSGNADSRLVQPSSSGTVTFRNLQHNTLYHVRGFVETSRGRFYGPVYSFRAGVSWQGQWDRWNPWHSSNLIGINVQRDSSFITTNQPLEIATTTARMSAHIPNRSTGGSWNHWNNNWSQWDHRIIERGFVWSSTNRMPTLSNSSARQNSNQTGTFEMTLTGLEPGTTYHVSAFYRTPSRTYFGNVVTINTPEQGRAIGDNATVSVTFRDLNGRTISTANVPTTVGTTLNAANLNIPVGYNMWPATWSYVVTGTANIVVVLAPVGHVPPTVQPPTAPGGAFFPVRGGNAFAPEAAVSRGELAQAIFNLQSAAIRPTGTSVRFNDTVGSPFSAAIDYVTARGLMNGYPDGTFRPGGELSRAEAATVLVRMNGLTGTGSATFTDLPQGHWARNYVALAADRNIINGYPDGTFGPGRPLSRAEAVALLVRADGRNLNPLQHQRFTDVPEWHWAFNYIMSAAAPRP